MPEVKTDDKLLTEEEKEIRDSFKTEFDRGSISKLTLYSGGKKLKVET